MEFIGGNLAVLVLVGEPEESRRDEVGGADGLHRSTRTTAPEAEHPAAAGVLWLHGFPILGREGEVDGPDLWGFEEVGGLFGRLLLPPIGGKRQEGQGEGQGDEIEICSHRRVSCAAEVVSS